MNVSRDGDRRATQGERVTPQEGKNVKLGGVVQSEQINDNTNVDGTLFVESERQRASSLAPDDNRGDGIQPADVMFVLSSRRLFIAIVTLLFAVAGLCFAKLTYVPEYYATSSLVVQANYSSDEAMAVTPVEVNFAVSLVPTYTQILKSNRVMDYVIDELKLDIPVEELRSYMGLKSVEDTSILHLTVTCPDPQLAIDISNSIAEVAPKAFQETIAVGTVRILDAAFISGIVGDKAILILILSGLIGFIGAFIFQIFLYVFLPKINHTGDIESKIGLQVLGEIEHIRGRNRKRGLLLYEEGATSKYIESYMTLGIVVNHAMKKKDIKKLLITSSKEDEGKTQMTANLGIALARAGKKVLLIDCDLRKPDLHEKFGIKKGSATAFYGYETKTERAECVVGIFPGLDIIPFITDIDKRYMFFQTIGFAGAISDFEQEYDIIIYDSAPIFDVTDSLNLVELSDAVLMVIKQDGALIEEVVKSVGKLKMVGGIFLGAVLNDVRFILKKSKYLNKYSYRHYYLNKEAQK